MVLLCMLQLLLFTIIGTLLLWFGYSLFSGHYGNISSKKTNLKKLPLKESVAGAPRTCPICSVRFEYGEKVKSSVFPTMNGSDRIMYISGCPWCLAPDSNRERRCPVCNAKLSKEMVLVARMYNRPGRSHVHVTGCSICKKLKKSEI